MTGTATYVNPFQSTLSVRRATLLRNLKLQYSVFQSTLSVRRATYVNGGKPVAAVISIHALRKESDHR